VVPEKGIVDMLMDNLNLVIGAIAVVVLGVLGLGYARRRKQEPRESTEPSILGAPTDQPLAVRRNRRPERGHQQQRVQFQLRAIGQPARHQ
jgi:hypothetical protein